MIQRQITQQILEDLTYFPVVGIIGPRQVGKTTLAKELQTLVAKPTLYLDLELNSDRFKLEDAQSYLNLHQDKCIIIDEIQLKPALFPLLRALIDQKREPARFIILGSASPELLKVSSETLAGRIAYSELTPFSYPEVGSLYSMQDHWLRGGFPDALLAPHQRLSQRWLSNFIQTFVEKDLRALGMEISAATLDKALRMISYLHGQILNTADLARSLGVSSPTAAKYLDLLEGGFMIYRLPPYFKNIGKRLVKSPKLYIRDSGILHQLLSIPDYENLVGNQAVGASWEGYVLEQIMRVTKREWQYFFYRTQVGAEVDIVLINPAGKIYCIEIKFSNSPSISKGFYQSVEDIQPDMQYVIIPNGERIVRESRLVICDLKTFLGELC